MSVLLSIISTLIAALDLVAFNGIIKAILQALMPVDPMRVIESTYQVTTLEWLGLIILGVVWLAGVLFVYYYYGQARTRRILFIRFARVTAVEVAIVALGYALPYVLARL